MYTLWFNKISPTDETIVGLRAVRIARLARANLPLPPGFVVTSEAYKLFLDGFREELLALCKNQDLNKASEEIKSLFLSKEIPEAVKEELIVDYSSIEPEHITDLDVNTFLKSKRDSFVVLKRSPILGLHDKGPRIFSVKGVSNLLTALKSCWASFFSPENLSYMRENKIPFDIASTAVIVSYQVSGTKSGTAHFDEKEIAIDACYGLSLPVQTGQISYDNYIISKDDLVIKSKTIREQEYAVLRSLKEGKLVKVEVLPEKKKQAVLSDHEARLVADLVREVHNFDVSFIQIEWMLESGEVYLLKATRAVK